MRRPRDTQKWYLIRHREWGVLQWSNEDERLCSCGEYTMSESLSGARAATLFATPRAARQALADHLTAIQRLGFTSGIDAAGYRILAVAVPWRLAR